MCCECCSETQRKVWVFGLGIIFAALGTTLLLLWPKLSLSLVHNALVLKEGSESYDSWVEVPIPIFLEFTLFNWTNPEDIRNPNIKPNFVEMGPYVFREKQLKEQIHFFENDTVSYFVKRTWFFDEQRSNGTLEDMLTSAHAITATVAEVMRGKAKFIKKIINFMLNHEGGQLYVTKSIGEWIFDGYQDNLLDYVQLFNITKIDIPFKRFGWMAERNGSAEYDGSFTIDTGVGDISKRGRLTHWNGKTNSGFYDAPCDTINGTTGDAFPPHMDINEEITIYSPDACRYMNLRPNGTYELYGLTAITWMGTIETLDSGAIYPNHQCFCNPTHEECPKTAVIDCKACSDKAPIYASFPHFHLADASYRDAITGMQPDPEKHSLMLAIEPYTGIPVQVNARLQINLMIEPDDVYDIYKGVQKVLMPMFWIEQKATLDQNLARKAKLAINLESYGRYAAIALIVLGGVMIIVGIVLTITKRWKRTPKDDDDEDILPNHLEPADRRQSMNSIFAITTKNSQHVKVT